MKKIVLGLAFLLSLYSCNKGTEKGVEKTADTQKEETNKIPNTSKNHSEEVVNSEDNPLLTKAGEIQNTAFQKNADDSYSFRYNLTKGEKYPFTLVTKESHTISDGENSVKASNDNVKKVEYYVQDISNGVYTLKVTSIGFSEKAQGPDGQILSYDTDKGKPADKDIAMSWSVYKAMVGQSYLMKIDQKGKVLSVTGLEAVRKKIEQQLKKLLSAEELQALSEMLKQSLSEVFVKAQFEESMNVIPDKNLKLKEAWSDTNTINEGPLKGSGRVTRTLASIDEKSSIINVSGTQSLSGKDSQEGANLSMAVKSDISGTIKIDTKSGWIDKVSLTKKETMKRTIEKDGIKQSMTENATTVTIVN